MPKSSKRLALAGLVSMTMACAAWAQSGTGFLEGTVKGDDGKGMAGALIRLERTDIKGNYQVKTDKKGHWFHAGLPLGGQFKVFLVVDGKDVDAVQGIKV